MLFFCVIICFIVLFFVSLCHFLTQNDIIMRKETFLAYADIAAEDLQLTLSSGNCVRRWHRGFNLPDGGRIYFEWRTR